MERDRLIKILDENLIVDESDYEFVSSLGLSIVRRGHLKHVVINTQPYYKLYLHRVLLKVTDTNVIVDHINRNGMDNRRSNLRLTTKSGNALNMRVNINKKSGLPKGVFNTRNNKYRVCIQVGGLYKQIGTYSTVAEAVLAYENEQTKIWNKEGIYALLT